MLYEAFFFDNYKRLSGSAVGTQGDEAMSMITVNGPECLAVGVGNINFLDFLFSEKSELTFVYFWWQFDYGSFAVEEKHQPVATAFVGLFGNHAEQMQVLRLDAEAGFFKGFADGAGVGAFSGFHFQLATYGAPQPLVRLLGPLQQQELASTVTEEYEDADSIFHGLTKLILLTD